MGHLLKLIMLLDSLVKFAGVLALASDELYDVGWA